MLSQTHEDIEYIVIDGGSTDGTKDVIQDFQSITCISERDDGIFDAMNKGLKLATGDYVNFLNSGDRLYDNDVLCAVEKIIVEKKLPDFLFGDSVEVYAKKSISYFKKARSIKSLKYGMPAHHQAMFYSLPKMRDFDLTYPCEYPKAADYALTAAFINLSNQVVKMDITICTYLLEGLSQTVYSKDLSEFIRIKKEVLGMGPLPIAFFFLLNKSANMLKLYLPGIYNVIRYPKSELLSRFKNDINIKNQ